MCECLKVGRLDKAGDAVTTPEGTVIQTMFCDACGEAIDLIAGNFDEENLDAKKPHMCAICGAQLYPGEGDYCELHGSSERQS